MPYNSLTTWVWQPSFDMAHITILKGFPLGNPFIGSLPLAWLSGPEAAPVLLLICLLLVVIILVGFLLVRRPLKRKNQLEQALKVKAKQLLELQSSFEVMRDDLNNAQKVVERKRRDLKMINHILDLKVERKTKELQEANTDLSTFLYRSSHDILGPMARMTGLCNLAQMEISDPIALGYLDKLASTATELNYVIKNIQDVFEIKNRELELGTFNLRETIASVIDDEFTDEMKSDVVFDLDIEADLMMTTDLYLLRMVFLELIKNSIIHRSQYRDEPSRILVKVERKSKKILVVVDDNGIGIPTQIEAKVFDMFQRTSELIKSTGMGLYIVKVALAKMKGSIRYISKEEPGARFELQIPNFQTLG